MRDPLGIEWWLSADRPSGRNRSPAVLAAIFVAAVLAFAIVTEAVASGPFSLRDAAVDALVLAGILVLLARLRVVGRRR